MNLNNLPGLQIKTSFQVKDAPNFKPDCWPPRKDFPVTLDLEGNILSRYGDVRWDLSIWVGHKLSIYFGDGVGRGRKISSENAIILRQIVAWWIWGPDAVKTAKSLVRKFALIKPLFWVCTDHGILATEIYKYPEIIDKLASQYLTRKATFIPCLVELFLAKDYLGFVLINEEGMTNLSNMLYVKESTQTAYIPPRIWSYQVLRLRECLEDFLSHKEDIIGCYNFCLDLYANNAGGSLSNAFPINIADRPFREVKRPNRISPDADFYKTNSGKVFYRSFNIIAKRYGIEDLLKKWTGSKISISLRNLSSYLSLLSVVGLAYTLNFSLMRVQEGSRLHANSYEIEKDELCNEIHTIRGSTTKTMCDDNARWIVPPTVKMAIDIMEVVANLRMIAAKENPHIALTQEDINRPILQSFIHEPWGDNSPRTKLNNKYKKMFSYNEAKTMWPKLFDLEKLNITKEDLEIANRLTSGLDPERYAVGKPWPLAWHQLRRTGAVNMLASGLVTESSLQFQLKHANRAMSMYYGKNYYKLIEPLSEDARNIYLREIYETIVRNFKQLQEDQYVSPHGKKRKNQILSKVSEEDHKQLINAAKKGKISYRQTLLGGCAKPGAPCPFGGFSNISNCMGYGERLPCDSILLDKKKLPEIKELNKIISVQIEDSEKDSPLYIALNAQLESSERAINVIENN